MKNKHYFSEVISTFFYFGKIKIMPGTIGAILAIPLWLLFSKLTILILDFTYSVTFYPNITKYYDILYISVMFFINIIIFIIGIITSDIYIKDKKNKDPQEVIIDEVVGQFMTLNLSIFIAPILYYNNISNIIIVSVCSIICPFIFFRLFDIAKPWPIKNIEAHYQNGFGIMLDDIVAAILASITLYAIIFMIIK